VEDDWDSVGGRNSTDVAIELLAYRLDWSKQDLLCSGDGTLYRAFLLSVGDTLAGEVRSATLGGLQNDGCFGITSCF
jgi:hypothetical protein